MSSSPPDAVVVNFNAPELNQLAGALARRGLLRHFVRPYVNKERAWERALGRLPMGRSIYAGTLGRRRLGEPALVPLTREAGVACDWSAALVGRQTWLPGGWRHAWTNGLNMQVRAAVSRAGGRLAREAGCIVAYEGFALEAFQAVRPGSARRLLNYPVAHHRERRRVREEELALEPDFAATWPGFADWGPGHEERLDEEIALADGVLLGSEYAARSFLAQGVPAHKLCVVPYGVDLQTFCPGPGPEASRGAGDRFEVIYAGQLTQRKGLSYLLRAYAAFARANTALTLVGAPVGSEAPLRPYAHLFEHVPHQTRPALAARYRRAQVFVLPTLVEGMPLVVLEAMACGLPVIVTANGPGGIVRDGIDGFIVPQRDAAAVQEKLELLYRDPALCAAMGRQAAQRAQDFSWEAYSHGVLRHMHCGVQA
ncbi:glycosyltransferase family 4 protein [Rubrivivax rivuli]|uniref:Glycosyltransferase n=1 Tax=Rubrivivax rivuli TaxID=1862385 RepID=A0A437REA2_9BURK|nr:glycosyltransferase family 4 protein [Rubrivivax rivuli]RVU45090.1 glycosyltransferase [Rubrivivax rivuli]